jgi:hypothetical protein
VVLMDTSVYPNLVAFTGIPLRRRSTRATKEIYREALAAPAAHAAIVLAFDGDEIDRAVKAHPEGLTAVRDFGRRASRGHDLRLRYRLVHPGINKSGCAVLASGKE